MLRAWLVAAAKGRVAIVGYVGEVPDAQVLQCAAVHRTAIRQGTHPQLSTPGACIVLNPMKNEDLASGSRN